MASLRSIRMGMSKSYQSLNSLGNENEAPSYVYNHNNIHTENASEWLGVEDNFREEGNRNRPLEVFKTAMSKVSRSGKYRPRTSKSSHGLREVSNDWNESEEVNMNVTG